VRAHAHRVAAIARSRVFRVFPSITGFFDRARATAAAMTEHASSTSFDSGPTVANLEQNADTADFDPPDPHAP
jgi:hypothetical protein